MDYPGRNFWILLRSQTGGIFHRYINMFISFFRYIEFRRWCNFTAVETWDDLAIDIPDRNIRRKMEELYGHPGLS